MVNHEAPKQRRLSASACDSMNGQQEPLGSVPYENGEMGIRSVLEGGCRMGEKWSEIRDETCEQRVEPEQRHGVTPE